MIIALVVIENCESVNFLSFLKRASLLSLFSIDSPPGQQCESQIVCLFFFDKLFVSLSREL